MAEPATNISLVDFGGFLHGSAAARRETAAAIDRAFRAEGFVYLANHGVPLDRVEECFEWSQRFFALPHETKMKAPHPPGYTHHRGFTAVPKDALAPPTASDGAGAGKVAAPDVRESFESGNPLDEVQPNIWLPDAELPGFREFMEGFFEDCSKLIHAILSALSLALELPDNLGQTHAQSLFQLRLLHYPNIPTAMLTSGARNRISAHCDYGTLTLLFQDDVGGLEVEDPKQAGVFRPVPPKKGTVVVNIADLMERWSNGRWKSTMHRVSAPPVIKAADAETDAVEGDEPVTKERYSIPFFAGPDADTVIDALPGTWDADNPKRHAKCTASEYIQMRMAEFY